MSEEKEPHIPSPLPVDSPSYKAVRSQIRQELYFMLVMACNGEPPEHLNRWFNERNSKTEIFDVNLLNFLNPMVFVKFLRAVRNFYCTEQEKWELFKLDCVEELWDLNKLVAIICHTQRYWA